MSESEPLFAVATFNLLYEAELAHELLQDESIESFIDGETVNSDWFMSTPVGGIKLLVAKSDFLRAERILNNRPRQGTNRNLDDYGLAKSTAITSEPENVRDDQSRDDETDEVETPEQADVESTIEHAMKCAVVGLVLLPPLLHLFSLSLLTPLLKKRDGLEPALRSRLNRALAIDVVVLVLASLFLVTCCVLFLQQPPPVTR